MNYKSGNFSIPLIWLSLGLLFAFLTYWNFHQHRLHKSELQKELSTQMELAISEVRDSSVRKLIDNLSLGSKHLSEFDQVGEEPVFKTRDSISEYFYFSNTQDGPSQNVESLNFLQELTFKKQNDLYSNFDSLNVGYDIGIQVETTESDSTVFQKYLDGYKKDELKDIEGKFRLRLLKNDLPTDFKVSKDLNDTIKVNGISVPMSYSFNMDNKKFKTPSDLAVFEKISSYLLQKLLPNLLLSLFLFSIVAWSYWSIIKTKKEQDQLMHMKNEFVSNMTHELKTPISTVSVALEAINDFGVIDDPEKTKEYIDISKHELNRLGILVDKVLKMSMYDRGDIKMNMKNVDLKLVINEIVDSLKLQFEQRSATINKNFEGLDFKLLGDKIHLTNVFYNLIENALKYGGKKVIIDIDLIENEEGLVINVKDSGVGIPLEYQTKVFDRFFRIPSNDQHNIKGHGLGLNYVKRVVLDHNGTIDLESKENEGTTFTVNLPKKGA